MTLSQVIDDLRELTDEEKPKGVHVIVAELSAKDKVPNADYPEWTPFDSFGATQVLISLPKAPTSLTER